MRGALAAAALIALLGARDARAQSPLLGAFLEGGGGVAVGGGDGFSVVERARTFVHAGVTIRLDDLPNDQLAVGVLADIEPRVALGIDARWGHWLSKMFLLEAGPVAYVVPETLFGISAGLRARVPLGKTFSLLPGFVLSGYFAGSDLPENSALVTGLLVLGIHANL